MLYYETSGQRSRIQSLTVLILIIFNSILNSISYCATWSRRSRIDPVISSQADHRSREIFIIIITRGPCAEYPRQTNPDQDLPHSRNLRQCALSTIPISIWVYGQWTTGNAREPGHRAAQYKNYFNPGRRACNGTTHNKPGLKIQPFCLTISMR